MSNELALVLDFSQPDAMFGDAPMLDDVVLDFDMALERAAVNANDAEAFAAVSYRLEQAREAGDLTRIYEMSMLIGATACMHSHLEDMAKDATALFESTHGKDDGHGHDKTSDEHATHNQQTCKMCKAGKACPKTKAA